MVGFVFLDGERSKSFKERPCGKENEKKIMNKKKGWTDEGSTIVHRPYKTSGRKEGKTAGVIQGGEKIHLRKGGRKGRV